MKLITAIVQQAALENVQVALAQVGIAGMTISEASGYARQRGHVEVYRGAEFTIDFVEKVRIEILSSDTAWEEITKTICDAARTGEIGDGKVWVTPIEAVIGTRRGGGGYAALFPARRGGLARHDRLGVSAPVRRTTIPPSRHRVCVVSGSSDSRVVSDLRVGAGPRRPPPAPARRDAGR
ncbi:P-II family nitrogen regulator [Acidipropionibacterium jensenii]|uniref:P-II family nitrogen regulator n=1 Tax=Acidipropionibacterium jensenii TaxID=1749 RepID=UPI003F512A5E